MEQKKDVTKRHIAESFKKLVVKDSFEKLTIKKITNEAGIIRPTFYNYYRDKYDVMEYLLQEEVLDGAIESYREGGLKEGLIYIVNRVLGEREYYQKVFLITGQNNFEDVFKERLMAYIQGYIFQNGKKMDWPDNPALKPYTVAKFETDCFIAYLRYWVFSSEDVSPEDVADGYIFLRREAIQK
ncbi:MAG: TetR/AcrR family transcriptional regulator [Eubacterium sp.]|nr:TetR/AcrR family transcriptional regulator [Eubacterium sp.]